MHAREGFSFGHLNNEGYKCLHDYKPGMSIDILVMGSSHMQAFQVFGEETASEILEVLSGLTVYNIGAGAHFFLTCVSNLAAEVKRYRPLRYIVIETPFIMFPDKDIKPLVDGTFKKEEKKRGTLRLLVRKNKFMKRLWVQFNTVLRNSSNTHSEDTKRNNIFLMNELMKLIHNVSETYDVKIIIAYHPSVSLNKDGTLKINGSPETVKQFSDLCTQNGIYFVDMSNRFLDEYGKNYTLPYGFMNSSVGKGHMNRYGHRMFAEEIYKLINRIEAQS